MHHSVWRALAIAWLLGFAHLTNAQEQVGLIKNVRFQDGLVVFAVPATWREEYDDTHETGTYYEDSPESGTLRLSVLSVRAPAHLSAVTSQDALRATGAQEIESLGSGLVLAKSVSKTTENGEPITLHHWKLAHSVASNQVRIAIFTYTVATSREASRRTVAEIDQVDQSIRNATFGPATSD